MYLNGRFGSVTFVLLFEYNFLGVIFVFHKKSLFEHFSQKIRKSYNSDLWQKYIKGSWTTSHLQSNQVKRHVEKKLLLTRRILRKNLSKARVWPI